MIIIEKCFKGAIVPDSKNRRYKARITFYIRREPNRVTYLLLSGKQTSKHRCLQPIKGK